MTTRNAPEPLCVICGKPIVFDVPRTMDHKCRPAEAYAATLREQLAAAERANEYLRKEGLRVDADGDRWMNRAAIAEAALLSAQKQIERLREELAYETVAGEPTPVELLRKYREAHDYMHAHSGDPVCDLCEALSALAPEKKP